MNLNRRAQDSAPTLWPSAFRLNAKYALNDCSIATASDPAPSAIDDMRLSPSNSAEDPDDKNAINADPAITGRSIKIALRLYLRAAWPCIQDSACALSPVFFK